MVGTSATLQADYVPLSPDRAGDDGAAGGRRAAGAGAVRPDAGRCKASAKAIEESLPDAVGAFVAWLVDREERLDGGRAAGRRRRAARAASAAAHRRPVPPLRQLRRRRHARATSTRSRRAASRTCSSAARRSTTARKSRRSAPRWPPSSGPTTSCRCSRRCRARSSRSTTSTLLEFRHRFGAFHPFRVPKELGGNSRHGARADRRADRAPDADRRRAAAAAAAAPRAATTGRSPTRSAGCSPRRARTSASSCGRPASRRSPTCCTSPSSRASTKPAAASRSAASSTSCGRRPSREARRGADPRRGQRRRAADDRAQGQGARVPGRHPRRPHLPHEPQRREPLSRRDRAGCARCGSAAGRRTSCTSTRPRKWRATRPKACASPTSPRRARAICSSCPALGDEPWEGGWLEPLNRALYPPMASRRTRGARAEVSGVQVEGLGAASGPNDETGGPVDGLSRASTTFAGRLLGRLVGSGRARRSARSRRSASAART